MIINACEDPNILRTIYFIQTGLKIVISLIPIPFIGIITYDIFKNIVSGNVENNRKNLIMALRRIIYLVILFLIPTIINLTMDKINELYEVDWISCIKNANKSDIEKFQVIYDNLKEEEDRELEEKRQYIEMPKTEMVPITYRPSSGDDQTISTGSFQDVAKTIWQKIVLGNHDSFTYSTTSKEATTIPLTGTQCNCSSYVSWVLYEYGLTEFKGTQKRTPFFYNNDWEKDYGWTVIKFGKGEDISNLVKSGDIVVRTPINQNGKASNGHVAIIAEANGKKTTAYDCGSTNNVEKGKYPNGRPEYWFLRSVRDGSSNNPGKIIRVTTKPVNTRR